MQQINPQAIIDELTRRLQQAILENVVLSARLSDALNGIMDNDETVIGSDITEE